MIPESVLSDGQLMLALGILVGVTLAVLARLALDAAREAFDDGEDIARADGCADPYHDLNLAQAGSCAVCGEGRPTIETRGLAAALARIGEVADEVVRRI